jgi:hypothetical protein
VEHGADAQATQEAVPGQEIQEQPEDRADLILKFLIRWVR